VRTTRMDGVPVKSADEVFHDLLEGGVTQEQLYEAGERRPGRAGEGRRWAVGGGSGGRRSGACGRLPVVVGGTRACGLPFRRDEAKEGWLVSNVTTMLPVNGMVLCRHHPCFLCPQ
jgi:hypothetical protein